MLVAFVGAPCSGKTTTAARLFADLKEQGLAVEFLTEYARMYIARRRLLDGDSFKVLSDFDQAHILETQSQNEYTFASEAKSIVIADSSAVSALLYMSELFLTNTQAYERLISPIEKAVMAASRYDVVFRCSPVRPGVLYDPNRLHSYEESVELDKRIDKVFELVQMNLSKVHQLFGPTDFRVKEAASVVMRKVFDNLKANL